MLAWPAAAAVLAGAAVLRLTSLGGVRPDPFYDAAVRSMGSSWDAFLFGALEPGGSVAIDKPPLALWLQVGSTKLFGWSTPALLAPEALGGCAAVLALFWLIRSLWGTAEAVASAAALAVLPVSVLTARSDTMDSVTVALTLVAALLVVRSARTGGRWPLAGAGVAIGLAFNAKLFQALVPVPALVVLYLAACPLALRERLGRVVLASAVAAAVGLSWLAVVTAAPPRDQPWAFGSVRGSAVESTFVYNGVARLRAQPPPTHGAAGARRRLSPAGPLRLLGAGGGLRARLAPELVPALVFGALALLAALLGGPGATRLQRAGAIGLGTWLLTGLVLFSALGRLQVRYLEGFTPAIAGVLGVGAVALVRRFRAPLWVAALAMALLLVAPVRASLALVASGASDSGHIGTVPVRETDRLSSFLRSHDGDARYELASSTAVKATALIVHDARPVLMLDTLAGRPLTSTRQLATAVRHGRVRYELTAPCRVCSPADRWAHRHGRDVSRQAGLPRGTLLALSPRDLVKARRGHRYRPHRRARQHRRRWPRAR